MALSSNTHDQNIHVNGMDLDEIGTAMKPANKKDAEEVLSNASSDITSVPRSTATQSQYVEEERDAEALRLTTSGSSHSSFSPHSRKLIVLMAAVAGFFSPLSANIYYPALNTLAADLRVSSTVINLTLTSYMIFQGLAPTIFGDLADMAGRRPAYLIGFVIYIAACVGIALQDSYAALFILRCLQSSGSSSAVALSSGVVAYISTSAERGTFMGWVMLGLVVGPTLGPILGGVLAQFLGWRSIFWFLAIFAAAFLVPFIIFLPETARNVVGDGSIPPEGWNMSLLNWIAQRKTTRAFAAAAVASKSGLSMIAKSDSQRAPQVALSSKRKLQWPNPLKALHVIFEKDVGLLLFYNSVVYTAFYDVTASTPYLLKKIYGLNDLQIGLSFLPFGVGCLVAALLNGRIMDWNYRRTAAKSGMKIDKGRGDKLTGAFPLEKARFDVAAPTIAIGTVSLLAYGWVMQAETHLAVPLVLQFIMGIALIGGFQATTVVLVDMYPQSPSTAMAANNLVRCLMGAAGTGIIITMIERMGRGWCFTFIAAVVALSSPILWILVRWGPEWREARRNREDDKLKRDNEERDAER